MTPPGVQDPRPCYHGTKADLEPGDLLQPGYRSNFGERRTASYVYLTATLDAATWGAELSVGEGPGLELPSGTHRTDRRRSEPPGQEVPGQPDEVVPEGSA
jgi:hypothetical protein